MPATEYVIVAAVSSEGKVAMSDKLNMVTADREFDGESFMLLDAVYIVMPMRQVREITL